MRKYTSEQLKRWSAKLENGFEFAVQHYADYGEKEARKWIQLDAAHSLRAELMYMPEVKNHKRTGMMQSVLHLSVWTENAIGMMSSGLGAFIDIGEPQKTRNWNKLAALSADLNDEKILELAREHRVMLEKKTVL